MTDKTERIVEVAETVGINVDSRPERRDIVCSLIARMEDDILAAIGECYINKPSPDSSEYAVFDGVQVECHESRLEATYGAWLSIKERTDKPDVSKQWIIKLDTRDG